MEALTIDEIISAKKNFLNIDKDLNLIHSVNETKETYYLIHCVAIITFLLLKQQALCDNAFSGNLFSSSVEISFIPHDYT